MSKLRKHANKSVSNKGIQAEEHFEFLKFPRSTQTDLEENLSFVKSVKATQTCSEIEVKTDVATQTETHEQNDEFIQTDCCIGLKQYRDESIQTSESIDLESMDSKRDDIVNMSEVFMRCNKRENSPFAAILPSVAGRSPSSSFLFPSVIANALKSGAGPGTKFSIIAVARFVVLVMLLT